MRHILIGSARKEVCKLFEMLLWQTDRTFTNAYALNKCLHQVKFSAPDLIIMDGSIDTPERSFKALSMLKEDPATADIPIVLLTEPARDGEEKARLLLAADASLPEPFNPSEIKSLTEQFL
ncbi:hypothetical protein [Malonomonas rubra]|uniref:hypothetical protein n=1 Tax=Malonomonas rubra TaxID=57040 RepID=UPI0026F0142E|nr:hypothetical protein [Malonomonas rubra]